MLEYRLFGESHSAEIGAEATGFPSGGVFDVAELREFLRRRSPSADPFSTSRREPDVPVFERGVEAEGPRLRLDGGPLRFHILNTDVRTADYEAMRTVPRPGHADYAAYLQTGAIPAGGGAWSGRMTAPYCVLGGIARQLLAGRGIEIRASVTAGREPPVGDSSGALVEVVATGVPPGLGGPGREGLESRIAAELFSIPAAKGVEFGDGFALAGMLGSEANDAFDPPMTPASRLLSLRTNHCGGILGGVSVGAPIVARVAFKPVPSIDLEQDSVDLSTMKPVKLRVTGRHDRCLAPRVLPVVESSVALAVLGLFRGEKYPLAK